MNQQQPPSQFQMFGAQPQAASAATRFMPYLRGMVGGGLVIGAAFMGSMVVCPPGWSLPDIAGRALGAAAKWEVWTSTEATVERERRVAEAVAKANAEAQTKMQIDVLQANAQAQTKMQIDVEAARVALAERTQGNALGSVFASILDVTCFGSKVVQAYGAQNTGRDWQDRAATTASATCGGGALIRDYITADQNQAVVKATTARGLPQAAPTMPATQPVASSVPPQAPRPTVIIRSLDDVFAIKHASQRYTVEQFGAAAGSAATRLPQPVWERLVSSSGKNGFFEPENRDVLTERMILAVAFAQSHQ